MAGAPLGNTNASRGREWADALRKARMQYEDLPNDIKRGTATYKIGIKVVEMALAGNMDAIREVGNRSDGKPVQVQEIYHETTARSVVAIYRAKFEDDSQVRKALKAAKADNLLPVLDQLIIEQPLALTHETTETTPG